MTTETPHSTYPAAPTATMTEPTTAADSYVPQHSRQQTAAAAGGRSSSGLPLPAAALRAADWVREMIRARLQATPAWVMVTQLFIGLGWLRAATEKLIDPQWWDGSKLRGFLAQHDGEALGWYQPFLDVVVRPGAASIALVVLLLQACIGVTMVLGRRVGVALAFGVFLNLHFLAAGAVDPSAFYLLAQGSVALWLAEQHGSARSRYRLRLVAVLAATLAIVSLPFVNTLHPAEVIEDPAVLMMTGGALALLGCEVAHRRITGGLGLP